MATIARSPMPFPPNTKYPQSDEPSQPSFSQLRPSSRSRSRSSRPPLSQNPPPSPRCQTTRSGVEPDPYRLLATVRGQLDKSIVNQQYYKTHARALEEKLDAEREEHKRTKAMLDEARNMVRLTTERMAKMSTELEEWEEKSSRQCNRQVKGKGTQEVEIWLEQAEKAEKRNADYTEKIRRAVHGYEEYREGGDENGDGDGIDQLDPCEKFGGVAEVQKAPKKLWEGAEKWFTDAESER
ncbi:MAG: hypothetical protein M1820_006819 [Bogoriella megaspora]|nr:MAG: hypothetical protein M1820_006819 [Bogoriella megaspora]